MTFVNPTLLSKQFVKWSPFWKQIEGPALSVNCVQVFDSHCEINSFGDVLGRDGAIRRKGRDLIGHKSGRREWGVTIVAEQN